MNPDQYLQMLSPDELAQIDMRAIGNFILDRTVTLSTDVNREIIKPLSGWLHDPDFLKKYEIVLEDHIDWAAYKRNQREWTKQQRLIAAERLRLYWQEIRRKRNLKKDMAKLLSNSNPKYLSDECGESADDNEEYITAALIPFSPKEQTRIDTLRELEQSRTRAPSDRLPWKAILASELDTEKDFTDLPCYLPENPRLDTAAKLQHILQMDTDGTITLSQTEPFGKILVAPQATGSMPEGSSFTIIDGNGTPYNFDWKTLNDAQRGKVLSDLKEGRILARCM